MLFIIALSIIPTNIKWMSNNKKIINYGKLKDIEEFIIKISNYKHNIET